MKELFISSLYVFLGGGAGSVFRFWVATFFQRSVSSTFPYGTLSVNVIGSFLIGFIIAYAANRSGVFPYWRQLFVIGFLGGFTTFSSFSWDSISLFKNQEMGAAFLNIGLNMIICLGAAWAGSAVWKGN